MIPYPAMASATPRSTLAAREADIVALTGVTFSQGGTGGDFSGLTAEGTDERRR